MGEWYPESWVVADEGKGLSVVRGDTSGVAIIYDVGGGMLLLCGGALLLTLLVVFELTRGLGRGSLRTVRVRKGSRRTRIGSVRRNRLRNVLTDPRWGLETMWTAGRWERVAALGPTFSSQVRSTNWLAIFCPMSRLRLGIRRWMMAGKYPSVLEKLWVVMIGAILCCALVSRASSRATKNPVTETIIALSLRRGGIVMIGVLIGRKTDVIRRPAGMVPPASRFRGINKVGSFSSRWDRGRKRG